MPAILGLDIGKKRVGIAKSDELGMFAHAIGFISFESKEVLTTNLKELIAEHMITKIVVGLPKKLDGTEGIAAEAITNLIRSIGQNIECPFEFWDERFSTKEAMRYMSNTSLSGSKKKKKVDALAAQIMLQNYLDCNK